MVGHHQTHETGDSTTDERVKVAAQCRDCGSVYSAWILRDTTVQPIGRKDGCQCGATEFEALSGM